MSEIEMSFCISMGPHLEILHLDKNYIQELPESFELMGKLKYVSLKNNQIVKVPLNILGSLLSLHDLHLDGNPLQDPVFGNVSKKGSAQVQTNPQGAALLAEIRRCYVV